MEMRGSSLKNHDLFNTLVYRSVDDLSAWTRVKRGLMVAIGCGCAVLGCVLVVTIVRPEMLQTMSTLELGVIIGLVGLPVLTILSVRLDRLVVSRSRAVGCVQNQANNDSVVHTLVAHGAHSRGIRVAHHVRVAETTEPALSEQADVFEKKSREPVEAA